jgi:hypothetical protein
MRRQRYWLPVVAIAVAGVAALAAFLSRQHPPVPGVRWGNVARIEVGMSRPEAEAVIGSPPQAIWPCDSIEWAPPGTDVSLMWSGPECDIWVYLDRSGVVIGRQGVGSPPASWYDRLLRRLGM